FEQSGFFAADVRTKTVEGVQLETESTAHDRITQVAGRTGLFQSRFKAFVFLKNLTVSVVVTHADTHGIGCNRHAFDDRVGVVHQDVAVFASARLALVGVAHKVLLTGKLARHEAPLQPAGETRSTATAQGRFFYRGDHLILG